MNIDDIKFDEKGLVPVVVSDAHTGQVLMVAYMNKQSLELTFNTGEANYFSRSRQKLWRKGETSGNIQKVVSIYSDCDNDCLLLKVIQSGVPCHTGAKTCFFNEIKTFETVSSFEILNSLQDIIQNRMDNPIEGSYTNYLINNGREKICKKVGEEASECIIAAMKQNNVELKNELADLIYHCFVLMKSCDLQFSEVLQVLQKRYKPVK